MSVSHKKVWRDGLKHCKDPGAFMEYSNDMKDVCKSIEEYSPIIGLESGIIGMKGKFW